MTGSTDFDDGIYREHLIELYKSPENYGSFDNGHAKRGKGQNESCGDEITMELLIRNGKVQDAKFNGSGCMVSVVSASMLAKKLKGLSIAEAKKLSKEDILNMLKVKLSPARIKCALIPFEALKIALR